MFSSKQCLVCNVELTFAQARLGWSCSVPACIVEARRRIAVAAYHCLVCCRPMAAKDARSDRTCGALACTSKRRVELEKAASAALLEAQQSKAEHERDRFAIRSGVRATRYAALAVPAHVSRVVPLPSHRKDELEAHVRGLAAAVFSAQPAVGAPGADDPGPTPLPVETHVPVETYEAPDIAPLCATCRGHCCQPGAATNAFLTTVVLSAVRAAHPDLDQDALVDHYVSRVPSESAEGSCVFHGASGCTLPRESRAEICNSFFCRQVLEAKRTMDGTPAPASLIVAFEDGSTTPNRTYVFEDGALHSVTPPRLPPPAPKPRWCSVCEALLGPHEAARGFVCTRGPCQLEARRRATVLGRPCTECGRPVAHGRNRPDSTCGSIECTRPNRMAAEAYEREARADARRIEMRRLRRQAAATFGVHEDTLSTLLIPANVTPLSPLPIERAAAMTEHIAGLIAEAFADDTPPCAPMPPDLEPTPPWMAAACAACRGFCCAEGNSNRAFMTVDTFRRVRAANGALDAAGILAEYTSRLPEVSHTDGCVFQGERGCTLPIELRADKCNAYFCPPFKHAQERHTELGATQAVLVAFDNKVATPERAYRLGDDGLQLFFERSPS
jgi:hypothetical protein